MFDHYRGHALANIAKHAASQHILYMEQFIVMPDAGLLAMSKTLSKQTTLTTFEQQYRYLQKHGLQQVVKQQQALMTQYEQTKAKDLQCAKHRNRACDVKVKYVSLSFRDVEPDYVFTQLAAAFTLVKRDPRFVAVNLVQEEDGKLTLRYNDKQMKMLAFFKQHFPHVHITLHAGELNPAAVKRHGLTQNIESAIHKAHAERIGHGTSIKQEKNTRAVISAMKKKKILVEINLTSNDRVLGVSGKQHPLRFYLNNNVLIALSTDDEGILRTSLSREYARAVTEHGVTKDELLRMNRNSLSYSFLPGKSLWKSERPFTVVDACQQDTLGVKQPQASCKQFLAMSEKATLQWTLERKLAAFYHANTHPVKPG